VISCLNRSASDIVRYQYVDLALCCMPGIFSPFISNTNAVYVLLE